MSTFDKAAFALLFYAWGIGFTAAFVFFGLWGWIVFFGPIFLLVWRGNPALRWADRWAYKKYR